MKVIPESKIVPLKTEIARLLVKHEAVSQYVDLGRAVLAILDAHTIEAPAEWDESTQTQKAGE